MKRSILIVGLLVGVLSLAVVNRCPRPTPPARRSRMTPRPGRTRTSPRDNSDPTTSRSGLPSSSGLAGSLSPRPAISKSRWVTGDEPDAIDLKTEGADLAMNPVARAFWNRWLGDRGEREAARFLKRRGLRILLRGYRDQSRGGRPHRSRWATSSSSSRSSRVARGDPAEAVTLEKQRRLTLASLHFLKRHGLLEQACGSMSSPSSGPRAGRPTSIEHFPPRLRGSRPGQMFR